VALALSDDDIARIALGVLDRSLPKAEWTHAAHFAVALWLLRQPNLDALRVMPGLIRAYNEATGVANTERSGYHETITVASLSAAGAWLRAHPNESLSQALSALLATEYGRSEWLLRFWSKRTLFSVEARRSWVEPDLAPLPFPCPS
jgi:hypothetical protein